MNTHCTVCVYGVYVGISALVQPEFDLDVYVCMCVCMPALVRIQHERMAACVLLIVLCAYTGSCNQ